MALFVAATTAPASASSQASKDEEKLQFLFTTTETSASGMRQCGMPEHEEKMIWSLTHLDQAYSRLNKAYRRLDPSVEVQIRDRIQIVCRALDCNSPPEQDICAMRKRSAPSRMKMFSSAVEEADKRIAKAGLKQNRGEESTSQVGECPLSPQHYEDAYRKSFRVNDLLCMKESLKRHHGLN